MPLAVCRRLRYLQILCKLNFLWFNVQVCRRYREKRFLFSWTVWSIKYLLTCQSNNTWRHQCNWAFEAECIYPIRRIQKAGNAFTDVYSEHIHGLEIMFFVKNILQNKQIKCIIFYHESIRMSLLISMCNFALCFKSVTIPTEMLLQKQMTVWQATAFTTHTYTIHHRHKAHGTYPNVSMATAFPWQQNI